ncbi:tyrosine-protein phosphatase [Chloroflexi bacterium TSY]|nr:tyrosine-protein phosphatase [Chloroflexi bacterium TSY]
MKLGKKMRLSTIMFIGVIILTACGATLREEAAETAAELEAAKETVEEVIKEELAEEIAEVEEAKEAVEKALTKEMAEDEEFVRLIPIAGTENFRDLGGYMTTDGKTVKPGLLYRSDSLADLENPEDLNELGLVTVVDFRADGEIAEGPDKLPEGNNIKYVNLPIGNPENIEELIPPEKLQGKTMDEFRSELTELYMVGDFDQIDKILSDLNIDIAEERIKRYVEFTSKRTDIFGGLLNEVLAADGEPLLFHCEGGKDRTGVGAALLLMTLGVPRETVMEDYLLTNEYTNAEELRAQAPQSLYSTIGAHEEQMAAALNYIDENYESFDDYRRTALGISDEQVDQMKDLLLE